MSAFRGIFLSGSSLPALSIDRAQLPAGQTGALAQLRSSLAAPQTFSRISGAGVTVNAAGVVTVSSALTDGENRDIVVRVQNAADDASERRFVLQGFTLPVAPTITNAGTISGTRGAGQTISGTVPTATGTPTPSVFYQWQAQVEGSWAEIVGATGQNYVDTELTAPLDLRRQVVFSNAGGTVAAVSNVLAGQVQAGSVTIAGTARAGQTITVNNTTGLSCYVQVMAPGTAAYDQPFIDLDIYNPEPSFVLGPQHVGHRIRVRAMILDGNGLPTGAFIASNELGPVLHATDPVPTWAGGAVATVGELQARMAANDPVIVLAAGTTWNATAFHVPYSNGRITTPQDNPARILNSYLRPSAWTGVTWDGIVHFFEASWLETNAMDNAIEPTGGCSNCIWRSWKVMASNVPPSVYQELPPGGNLLLSRYRQTGLVPPPDPNTGLVPPFEANGTFGPRFVVDGPNFTDLVGMVVEGGFSRNVSRGLMVNASTIVEHFRVHGFWADGMTIRGNTGGDGNTGGRIRDYYISHLHSLYDEWDASTPNSGSGGAPHSEPFQTQGAVPTRMVVDGFAYVVGNTRAYGIGPSSGSVNPNLVTSAETMQPRFRRALFGGSGSITLYSWGSDYQYDYVTSAGFGGVGSQSLRFEPLSDEGRVSRSIIAGPVTTGGPSPSRYVEFDEATVNVAATLNTILHSDLSPRPDTLAEAALLARPRLGFEGRGALTASGHMRVLGAFPASPVVSATPTAGGFSVSLGDVTGAQSYRIRYRRSDLGGAWTVPPASATPEFTATGLGGPLPFEVQAWVRTADGLSNWSASVNVTTDAAFIGDFPAGNSLANLIVQSWAQPTAAANWTPFTNVNIPAHSKALVYLARGTANPITLNTGVDAGWALEANLPSGTLLTQQIWSFYNNSSSPVPKSFGFLSAANRQAAVVLVIVPRTSANAGLDVLVSDLVPAGTASANPPALNLGSARRTLWLASAAYQTGSAMSSTAIPTDFALLADRTPAAPVTGASGLVVAARLFEAQTLDPTSFTFNTAGNTGAVTSAVFEVPA